MTRPKMPQDIETALLVTSRRRCTICFGLNHDLAIKRGQIAHLDRNPSNHDIGNLVYLCLEHHDLYDSRTSQSKSFSLEEVKHHREDLYHFNRQARAHLESSGAGVALSNDATRLARYLSEKSTDGRVLDPQVHPQTLIAELGLTMDELELAVDELTEVGFIASIGPGDFLYPLDRLFWETDALFTESDPVLDAQAVAHLVAKAPADFVDLKDLANDLSWEPRRLNPATTYLVEAGLVDPRTAMGSAPFALLSVIRTSRTKRFVRALNDAT